MATTTTLDLLRWGLDPPEMMRDLGMEPDPWQARALRSTADRELLLCCRQSGKGTTTAVKAMHVALFTSGSLVLLLSPTQRQSGELFLKVKDFHDRLGRPGGRTIDSATTLTLGNGSRIVSLPGNPGGVRGFSAPALVVIDEAAQAPDELFTAVAPMLATGRGRMVWMSTPFGARGIFHAAWNDPAVAWHRIKATALDCPRIDRAWLAEQRQLLGDRYYSQEFMCEFVEGVGQVFSTESIMSAFDTDEQPLFGPGPIVAWGADADDEDLSPIFAGGAWR